MRRHVFSQFTVRVKNGGVHLSFYLTTPVFESLHGVWPRTPICIHRTCEPRFTWGRDYAEHFDGLDVGKSRVIFEGPIEPINNRKFEYVDEKVEAGRTYAYWVSSPTGRLPTGPVAVRVRDPRIWWPHHEIESRLDSIVRAHPALATSRQFGTTVGGHAMPGLRVGNHDRCIAMIGTVHAGESGPELMIPVVERLLTENAALLAQVGVAILPNVNIDERERLIHGCPWYLRTNARGVDINRNFDADWGTVSHGYGLVSSDPDALTYRGPEPESEPETQAVVRFIEAIAPKAALSYHALASITGAMFLAPCAGKDDGDYVRLCESLVEPFIAAFYPTKRWRAGVRFGTSSGSLPAYLYRSSGVPAFDMEWDGNPDAQPSLSDLTTHKMLKTYQNRHYHGLTAMLKTLSAFSS